MSGRAWAPHTVLGGVLESQILDPRPGHTLYDFHRRRIVDVVCRLCGRRLAIVSDDADGPWATGWEPTSMTRPSTEGEPFWQVHGGPLPADDELMAVRCFDHGLGVVRGAKLREQVDRYRRTGRRPRLLVTVHREPSTAH